MFRVLYDSMQSQQLMKRFIKSLRFSHYTELQHFPNVATNPCKEIFPLLSQVRSRSEFVELPLKVLSGMCGSLG
jgi:hypothetical protein